MKSKIALPSPTTASAVQQALNKKRTGTRSKSNPRGGMTQTPTVTTQIQGN